MTKVCLFVNLTEGVMHLKVRLQLSSPHLADSSVSKASRSLASSSTRK